MKYNILVVVIFFLTSCSSDRTTDFKLRGRLKNLNGSVLILKHEGKTYGEAIVKNDTFSLEARLPNREVCTIIIRGTVPEGGTIWGKPARSWVGGQEFFVEQGASYMLLAEGYNDFFDKKDRIVTTSISQKEFIQLEKLKNEHWKLVREKKVELGRKRDDYLEKGDMNNYRAFSDSVRLMETSPPSISIVVNKFLDQHPNTYASIYTLATSRSLKKNLDFYNSVYQRLKPEFKNHRYAREYKEKADNMQRILANEKFKVDIYARDKTGRLFDFDDFKGYQMVFIDIWASWCMPCLEQMPAASKMQKELERHKVVYAYLSIDDNSTSKAWEKLNSSLKLERSFLLDSSANKQFQSQLVVETVPRYFIVNNKGELLEKEAPGPGEPEKLLAVVEKLKQNMK